MNYNYAHFLITESFSDYFANQKQNISTDNIHCLQILIVTTTNLLWLILLEPQCFCFIFHDNKFVTTLYNSLMVQKN